MSNHVLITQKLLPSCADAIVERFTAHHLLEQEDRDAFLKRVGPDIRAIASGGAGVNEQLMAALPNLEMISGFGVGYDGVDVKAAKARGIRVTNTPSVLNDAMAEITLGLMISLARKIPQADRYVRDGKWKSGAFPFQTELTGKTVGIVGMGRIGKEIANRCVAMKMRVVYFGRNKQAHQPYIYYDNLEDMARDTDWLVVVTPGGAATRHLINRGVMEALGPDGSLVNVARGTVVDQSALIDMLQSGGLGGAALDVFDGEPNAPEALFALDNVVLSPHQGSATHQTRYAMGQLVVANLDAFFAGDPLLTQVV